MEPDRLDRKGHRPLRIFAPEHSLCLRAVAVRENNPCRDTPHCSGRRRRAASGARWNRGVRRRCSGARRLSTLRVFLLLPVEDFVAVIESLFTRESSLFRFPLPESSHPIGCQIDGDDPDDLRHTVDRYLHRHRKRSVGGKYPIKGRQRHE